MQKIKTLADVEREHILQTLMSLRGNRSQTAKALEIGIRTLQRKLLAYGIGPGEVYGGASGAPGKMIRCEETGKVFTSLTEASHATGISVGHISFAVRYGTTIKGLTFKRVDSDQLKGNPSPAYIEVQK